MESERKLQARRYWIALVFVLIGILAGVWHNDRVQKGKQDFIESGIRFVLAPPANVVSKSTRWMGSQVGWLFRGHGVEAENQRLRERVAVLLRGV